MATEQDDKLTATATVTVKAAMAATEQPDTLQAEALTFTQRMLAYVQDVRETAVATYLANLPTKRGKATLAEVLAQAQNILGAVPLEYRERDGQIKRTELAQKIIQAHRSTLSERHLVRLLTGLIKKGELK